MTKYLLNRLLRGLISIVIVVAVVMVLIYSLMDRMSIFAGDPDFSRHTFNDKTNYCYQRWESYGYLDYVTYTDFLNSLVQKGELTEDKKSEIVGIGRTADKDSAKVAEYVDKFTQYYQSLGYKIERKDAVIMGGKVAKGGQQALYAYKNIPLTKRLWEYFSGLIHIDNIHYVPEGSAGLVGERGLSFTWHDPVYGGDKFSPAIIGNGTQHKYLLYFDSTFPFIHQNVVRINLGKSYSVERGVDLYDHMVRSQGTYVKRQIMYPAATEFQESADDLHTAVFVAGSFSGAKDVSLIGRFNDDYTNVSLVRNGLSKVGYSFVIGIFSVFLAYLLGIPLGIIMARKKDKLIDKIGTLYIVFIIAVPSLAYIFLFRELGGAMGLPKQFDTDSANKLMYILPIVSLALPSVANLMKWLRRYMIDQMNSDYVKFARSGGLSENEIFSKHILKNAAIPIIHGVPGSVLGALTGAIITESVYSVPGAGKLLTNAIAKYDNGVIVGLTLFYAVLSVLSIILGDILMSMVDPRISFSSKAR